MCVCLCVKHAPLQSRRGAKFSIVCLVVSSSVVDNEFIAVIIVFVVVVVDTIVVAFGLRLRVFVRGFAARFDFALVDSAAAFCARWRRRRALRNERSSWRRPICWCRSFKAARRSSLATTRTPAAAVAVVVVDAPRLFCLQRIDWRRTPQVSRAYCGDERDATNPANPTKQTSRQAAAARDVGAAADKLCASGAHRRRLPRRAAHAARRRTPRCAQQRSAIGRRRSQQQARLAEAPALEDVADDDLSSFALPNECVRARARACATVFALIVVAFKV